MFQYIFRKKLSAALIAAIVASTLWLGYLAAFSERTPSAGAPAAAQDVSLDEIRIPPDYPLRNPNLDLAETTARPLFSPSRRPAPGTATEESSASGAWHRGRYLLSGVSIASNQRVALLLEVATNKTVRVEQNKELGGMLVESVTPTKVILRRGTEREEIPLKIAPAPKLAAAVASKADNASTAKQAAPAYAPPAPPMPVAPTLPAAAAVPGVQQPAADIANADPITEADVAERTARVAARRNRQSASGQNAPR